MQPAGERDITQATPEQGRARTEIAREASPSISVETLLWVVLIVAAGLLRLADLDHLPFTTAEATRSLDAASVAEGEVPEDWRGDLGATVTSYAFRVFSESEVVARFVPALAGLALVTALWGTRPHIGRTGALVTAILVAFSPLFVFHARTTTEYGLGPLVSLITVVSLFSYLRNPRTAEAFPIFFSLALALLTDAISALTIAALLAFILLEVAIFRSPEVAAAGRAFRSSPLQLVSALFVLAAGVQLGITRFGTSLEASLPGLQLVGDMFDSPADAQKTEYPLALLVGYEWPLLLGGTAGFLLLAVRFVRGSPLFAFERFLLVWALTGVFALVLVTPGPPGQLLILLLPLALLAGRLAQETIATFDWGTARSWWPAAACLAAIVALGALLMTEWSSGNASPSERTILAATPLLGLAVLAIAYVRSRAARVIIVPVVAVVAAAFLTHSSLALAFGDGTEFMVGARLTPRAEQLRDTIDRLSAERDSDVRLDAEFSDELGWTLRDSRVVFGGNAQSASILVTSPDAVPPGYAGLTDVWRIAEGWYPDEVLAPRRMWRWLLYREPFGTVDFVDVRIYVRTV